MEQSKSLSVKTLFFNCNSTHRYFALMVVIFVAFKTVSALSVGEKTALQQILNNFQDLTSVASWVTVDDFGNYYGRSWNASFEDLCLIDGYDYYGIFCQNGQVVGLRVTNYWGFSISKDFSAAVGLVNLVNFTEEPPSYVGRALLDVLAQNIPLKHVNTSWPLVNFSRPEILESVSGDFPVNYLLQNMTNLRRLKLTAAAPYADLSPLCDSSLVEIDLSSFFDSQLVQLVNCLPTLQKVTFRARSPSDSDPLYLVSSSLTFLSLYSTGISLDINCPSLEYLEISYPHIDFSLTAPNLKHLIFRGFLPPSFTSLTQLETFKWVQFSDVVPLLSFAPNLKSFSLESSTILNTNLTELWQSIPSTIQTVSLEHVSFTGSMDVVSFPSHWTSLTSLTIRNSRTIQNIYNVSSILELRTLEALQYYGQTSFGDLKLLYALTNLKKLIFGLQSSAVIPPDFFRRMPQLTDVTFDSMFFTGPIPWYGWENLEYAYFSGYFTSWPALVGSASKLKYLSLNTLKVALIPTDEDFRVANLTSLTFIKMIDLGIPLPLPTFWADLPKLRDVEFNGFNFQGPVSFDIRAPMLRNLLLSPTSLCGSLPNFSIPTHLDSLYFRLSKFTGTIPATWQENLSLHSLNLESNRVTGTIPANLLTHHISPIGMINLNSTLLSGPLWNMSRGVPAFLRVSSTQLDICAIDPSHHMAPNSTYCAFDKIPKCPARCPSYWEICRPIQTTCTESLVVVPTSPICTALNQSCPLPRPGDGFQCNRGVWILLHDLSSGSVTLPPDAGPVIIYGDLDSNETIVFSGTGTTIQVEGCVENIEIIVEIHSTVTSGNITLLNQLGSNCTKDLGKIPVQLVAPEIECKTLQVSNAYSQATLNLVFSYQGSCSNTPQASNHKWTILGASIGGAAVFFAISFAILYWNSPGVRAFLRTCDPRKALTAK